MGNKADRLLTKISGRLERITGKVVQDFKSTKRFAENPITNEQKFMAYSQLTPEDKMQLFQESPISMDRFVFDMEQFRNRRNL